MTHIVVNQLAGIVKWTHHSMIALTEDLSNERFAQHPSPSAPPIGWHLFHIARWADRLQASLLVGSAKQSKLSHLSGEIWTGDDLAIQWGLKPGSLGLLEAGTGMDVDSAVSLALAGKSTLLDYARRTFSKAEQALSVQRDEQLQDSRLGILPRLEVRLSGELYFASDYETILLNDLLFHISHGGRHLGMIEGLRGALFAMAGTASV